MSESASPDDWPPCCREVRFAESDVHLWRVSLDRPESELPRWMSLLSDDERRRAERYRIAAPRRQFITARSALRRILAMGLGVSPMEIGFEYGPHGKPLLREPTFARDVQFNVSHSGELALIAVARRRRLGVDLERIRSELRFLPLAQRFFSPREVQELQRVSAEQQREAFFHCWTRKESYIKAEERGLSLPLDRFDVSLQPEAPACLLQCLDDPHAAARWSMVALDPAPGYVGALIAEGADWTLHRWEWREHDLEIP